MTFPFFVGCDRSGTTLIQAVFSGNSSLAIPYESHFIVPLLRRRVHYEGDGSFDLEGFARDLLTFPFAERWGLDDDAITSTLAASRPTSTPGAIGAVFDLFARSQGRPRAGDKTPGYVRHIPLLAGAFPEARFVHIIRDGRDVALSLLEVEWGPVNVVDAARFWKQRVEAGRAGGRPLGPQRYTELHYERFLDDLEGETKRICGFLGLPFEPEMLDYRSRADQILEQTQVPHRHEGLKEGPTKRRRDWSSQMSRDEVALFEAIAGPTLTEFGYERGVSDIPTSVRVRARAKQLTRKLRGIPDRVRWEMRPKLKRVPKV